MLMKKIYFIAGALLLAMAQSYADSSGTGSFSIITSTSSSDSETNTAKPKTTIFKPAITRAELKVSRSLNPDSMQTLNVRTNNGGIATILVKKRDGKNSVNNEPRQSTFYDVGNQYTRGEVRNGFFGPVQVLAKLDDPHLQKIHHQQQQFEYGRNNWMSMQPVTTLQQQAARTPYRFSAANDEKSTNLINSFMKHVQQVESSRQSRSPSSDGLRNDRAMISTKIPEPVTINSESVYVKDNQNAKRARSLMEIDSDGIPLINGVRVPDDENDKRQTWRNARVINGELVPYENGYVPPRTVEYGQLIYPVKKDDGVQSRSKGIGPFTTADNFSEETSESENLSKSIGPFSVRDMMFSSRSSSDQNSGIGPFSVADNSRTSNVKLIDYIKKINDQEHRKDYFARTPKDIGNTQQIQRRMLINPGNAYFPPSSRYSIEKSKQGELTPILQYAHPEFGLQSVDSSTSSYEQQSKINPQPKHNYYTQPYQQQQPQQRPNINNNNNAPMYQIEPALNTREYYNYQKSPAAAAAAIYPQYSNNMNNNYAYVRRRQPEQPFWMKISNQFRDTFQNGFAQVHEIAKPVMDPIMEAGEKISQNLGFSHPVQAHAQEKVGVYVPNSSNGGGSSYIFPALGMLAGGAALGIGALTMGRIFDVSSLLAMRSSEEGFDFDQKRALEAIRRYPTTTLYLVENDEEKQRQSLESSSSSGEVPSTYATTIAQQQQPNANFYEVIAIENDEQKQSSSQTESNSSNSSIDPVSHSQSSSSELVTHQRRKRNK